MQELWQWVHSCYGDELGLTSDDDDDYVAPSPLSKTSSDSRAVLTEVRMVIIEVLVKLLR